MRATAQGGARGGASRHKKTDCLYKTIGYLSYLAEKQGFEPWEGINPQRFSRPPLSAAQPPLQAVYINPSDLKINNFIGFF